MLELVSICGQQVEGLDAVFGSVGANGFEASMAEQLRNEDKVCAAAEEGYREGVPTGVGGDLIIETASDDDGSEDAAGGAVESLPPRRQQQFLGSAARVTGW